MPRRSPAGPLRLALLALVLGLAGCVSPGAPAAQAPADEPAAPPADGQGAFNQHLLDAPRPPSATVSRGAEPSILVAHDGTVFVGDTSGLARSRDGGATWQRVPIPFINGFFRDGWALAQDDAGTLYVAMTNGHLLGIASSKDGGDTWRVVNHAADFSGIADRPWIAARGDGELALVFYDAGRTLQELCLQSSDGGVTFLERSLATTPAYPNAGNLVFDAQGNLYYSSGTMTYRFEGGCSGKLSRMPNGNGGAQIFTQVAVDDAGRVYVARPTPDNSGMVLTATHGLAGATRKSLVVSPPELRSNTFGTLSVHGDEVAVAWYGSERAGDPSAPTFGGAWNVYVARVGGFWTDAPAIEHVRLTTEPNHVGSFCMGGVGCGATAQGDRDLLDYFMIDHAPDGTIHVAYGHDGATRDAEVRHARIDA